MMNGNCTFVTDEIAERTVWRDHFKNLDNIGSDEVATVVFMGLTVSKYFEDEIIGRQNEKVEEQNTNRYSQIYWGNDQELRINCN